MKMSELLELNNLSELCELRDKYRIDWPKYMQGYYTLNNYITWYQKCQTEPLKHTKIFSYQGDWRDHGLFMIIDRYHLMINSLRANDTQIADALKQLDWTQGYKISSVAQQHFEVVIETLKALAVPHAVAEFNIYHLPRTRALAYDLSCPPGFELGTLKVEDAALINSLWYPRQSGSLQYLKRLIELNLNVALYDTADGGAPKLVAWCLRCHNGYLGTLHVLQTYRRRGLAELVVKVFAQRIATMNEDILLTINTQNVPSNTLFNKLQFQKGARVYHMRAYKVSPDEVWLED